LREIDWRWIRIGRFPLGERFPNECGELIVRRIADGDDGCGRRAVTTRMKGADFAQRHAAQRSFGADRQVAVRMALVQQLRVNAIGQRRWRVAQLHEPIEPEIAHAIEIALFEPWLQHHVSEQLESARRVPREHRQFEQGAVGPDFGFELRSDAGERIVQVQRIQRSASFIEEVAGDRRQPGALRRIACRPERQQDEHADERHLAVLDRPEPDSIVRLMPSDFGKLKRRIWPERRQPRAIDAHQLTVTGLESESPSAIRPRGTTLRATRSAGRSHSAAVRFKASAPTFR